MYPTSPGLRLFLILISDSTNHQRSEVKTIYSSTPGFFNSVLYMRHQAFEELHLPALRCL